MDVRTFLVTHKIKCVYLVQLTDSGYGDEIHTETIQEWKTPEEALAHILKCISKYPTIVREQGWTSSCEFALRYYTPAVTSYMSFCILSPDSKDIAKFVELLNDHYKSKDKSTENP